MRVSRFRLNAAVTPRASLYAAVQDRPGPSSGPPRFSSAPPGPTQGGDALATARRPRAGGEVADRRTRGSTTTRRATGTAVGGTPNGRVKSAATGQTRRVPGTRRRSGPAAWRQVLGRHVHRDVHRRPRQVLEQRPGFHARPAAVLDHLAPRPRGVAPISAAWAAMMPTRSGPGSTRERGDLVEQPAAGLVVESTCTATLCAAGAGRPARRPGTRPGRRADSARLLVARQADSGELPSGLRGEEVAVRRPGVAGRGGDDDPRNTIWLHMNLALYSPSAPAAGFRPGVRPVGRSCRPLPADPEGVGQPRAREFPLGLGRQPRNRRTGRRRRPRKSSRAAPARPGRAGGRRRA